MSEGLLLGNVRFLGGLQLNVSEWAVFELRAGGVISRFQTQSLPFHFDTGFRCWLADRSAPVRPFLSTGLGAAEYDAIFRVTVVDCLNADSALSEACRSGGAAGTRKELVGAERLSFFFAAARIGAAWYFAETQMLSLGLSAIVTFPEQTGFVFQPALGYGGEL